ncbi:thioredoxin family protein [Yimella sp. cx-573]|nr:thioredoxin family protein [Yimella sp. cx-573]
MSHAWSASEPPTLTHFTGYRIDADTDAVVRYGVVAIPTVLLLRDGREIARLGGLIRDHNLEDAVRAATC